MENVINVNDLYNEVKNDVREYRKWYNEHKLVGGDDYTREDVRSISPLFYDEFIAEMSDSAMRDHMLMLCLANMAYYYGQIEVLCSVLKTMGHKVDDIGMWQDDIYTMHNGLNDAF